MSMNRIVFVLNSWGSRRKMYTIQSFQICRMVLTKIDIALTLVCYQYAQKLSQDQYKKAIMGHFFVHSHVKKGILPTILSKLLAARKRAKKDMKNAPTEFEKAIQIYYLYFKWIWAQCKSCVWRYRFSYGRNWYNYCLRHFPSSNRGSREMNRDFS